MASNDIPQTERTLVRILMTLVVMVAVFFFAAWWSFIKLNARINELEIALMQQAVSLNGSPSGEAKDLDVNKTICQMLNLSAAAIEVKDRFKCD